MTKRWAGRDERGQGAIALVVVILVVVAAVIMLIRTQTLASAIHSKTGTIAETGQGIGTATDAILQLDQTNQLGASILETSKPLAGQVARIVEIATAIDNLATSINATAVNVNGTSKGINGTAATIHGTLQRINNGVEAINRNVDTAIDIARRVKDDTANILGQAVTAHNYGACISETLGASPDGHCR